MIYNDFFSQSNPNLTKDSKKVLFDIIRKFDKIDGNK
jgi:hypothetical protein